VAGMAYDRDGNIHGGMGVDWGDFDNDGRFDLLVTTFQNEPKSLYHNEAGGIFTDVAYPSGIGSAAYSNVAFGCKFLDYDNDGRLDLLVVDSEGKALLLHNEKRNASHWLRVRLIGGKSNRDGYGARVTAQAGERRLVRLCHADGSYLSSSDPRVHFGLGSA